MDRGGQQMNRLKNRTLIVGVVAGSMPPAMGDGHSPQRGQSLAGGHKITIREARCLGKRKELVNYGGEQVVKYGKMLV